MVNKYIKNTKGVTTIYVILFLAIFIPIILFFTIDLPLLMGLNRKSKGTMDNAASTAILQINEDKIAEGILSINESDAKKMALKVISETFNLNDDLSVKSDSLITKSPKITIVVINDIAQTPSYTTPNGTFHFKNPSVLVYGEIPINASFFKTIGKTIKYTAVAQVQFKK